MMLENLGEVSAAGRVETAIGKIVANDIKGLAAGQMGLTTSEVGDLVLQYISR